MAALTNVMLLWPGIYNRSPFVGYFSIFIQGKCRGNWQSNFADYALSDFCWYMSTNAKTCQFWSKYVMICQKCQFLSTVILVDICLNGLVFVDTHQFTMLIYVCICQCLDKVADRGDLTAPFRPMPIHWGPCLFPASWPTNIWYTTEWLLVFQELTSHRNFMIHC